jgi:hypothetical protein
MNSWQWFEKYLVPPQDFNLYPKKNPIAYGVNSQNYRCPEFDTIDWANSYVLLGGSDVYGEGLEDNQIVSYYLEKMLGEPVINLAVPAASNQLIVLSMAMLAKHHKPKKWIVAWSDSCRWLHWNKNAKDDVSVQAHRASHEQFCSEPWPQLMDSLDWYSSQARIGVQAIAENNIIEFGFGEQIDPEWAVHTFDLIDEGRVEHHPGPQTNKMIAEWLCGEIKRNDETDQ